MACNLHISTPWEEKVWVYQSAVPYPLPTEAWNFDQEILDAFYQSVYFFYKFSNWKEKKSFLYSELVLHNIARMGTCPCSHHVCRCTVLWGFLDFSFYSFLSWWASLTLSFRGHQILIDAKTHATTENIPQ